MTATKINGSPPFSPPSGPTQRLFQEPPAKSKFLAIGSKWLIGGVFAVTLFLAGAARAVINPALQPFHLLERYKTALVGTVASIDEKTRIVTLAITRVTQGDFADTKVTLTASEETMAGLLSLGTGQTVVAFVGNKRKADGLLFYGSGIWNHGRLPDAAKPNEWIWTSVEQGNNELAGIFNGAAERLAELLTDVTERRDYFPFQPYIKFQDDLVLGTFDQSARGVALADLDGDGKLDAIATSQAGVRVWLQREGLKFEDATAALGLAQAKASSVAVADVDCDGHLALLLDGVLWSGSEKGFVRTDRVPAIGEVITATLADMNGDGWPDVLAATDKGLRVYLNPAKPGAPFTDATAQLGLDREICGAGLPGLVAAGDWDGRTALFYSAGKGLLLVADAKGVFQPRQHDVDMDLRPAADGQLTGGAAFAPLWQRDAMALLVPRHAGFSLLMEYKDKLVDVIGSTNETSEPSDRQLWTLAEDLNADGEVDIYTASGSVGSSDVYHMHRGYGSYMRPMKYSRAFPGEGYATGSWGVATGDVDGDGALDLLLGCTDGTVRLVMNNSLSLRKDVDEVSAIRYLLKLVHTKVLRVEVKGPRGLVGAGVTLADAQGRVVALRRMGANSAGGSWSGGPLVLAVREPGRHMLTVRYSDGLTVRREVDTATVSSITVSREDTSANKGAAPGKE